MTQQKLPPLEEFNAQIVQAPLNGLLTNMDRELERRLKQAGQSGDRETERRLSLLMIILRFTINSYEAVCFLISTMDENPKRKNRFGLVVPPANRQILDLLFTLVFMMDDFPARSLEYELSGYRQLRDEYDKFYGRFGTHPKWRSHFANLQDLRQTMEKYLPITPAHKADPTVIPYWRSPFRLKKIPTKSQPFLEFLDKWLYGETSAQAHLNAAGLFSVGAFVLSSFAPEDMRKVIEGRTLQQYTFRHFSRTLITVLAIACEIDNFCQFNNRETLARLWVMLGGYAEEAKDVYEQRYQAMLT